MKLLPLFFACVTSVVAHAQNNPGDFRKLKQQMAELNKPQGFSVGAVRPDTAKQLSDLAELWAKPAPGAYRLPQDNMPCLVPNPNATAPMPNAWQGESKLPFTAKPPRMPNPAKPLILSPAQPRLNTPDTK